ncbi:hypothetical protein F5Y04DRAFT_241800 [Hypomontagnella monticulosa]|nr:hypothetical protein F5Y04DRAFT_241800 [Hypomontagnella monticulosa]
MRISSLLAATAAASTASAAVMRIAASSISWKWTVTGWSAGCAEQCHYDFNVTAVGNSTGKPATPSFKAYCSGEGEGAGYQVCKTLEESETDYRVAAQLLPSNSTGSARRAQIQVSLQYTDLQTPSTWWNYTGKAEALYNEYAAPFMNFTITPDTVYGVA